MRGTIGDRVWWDKNGNGIQDSGEPGLGGVAVTITGPGNFTASTTTTASGLYQFTSLCKGSYVVSVPAPLGFEPTTSHAPDGTPANNSNGSPASVTLTTGDSQDNTMDFGFRAVRHW